MTYAQNLISRTAMYKLNFKLITFDVTGTLLKFKEPVENTYATIAAQHGIQVSPERVAVNFRRHWQTLSAAFPNFGCGTSTPWMTWWKHLAKATLIDSMDSVPSIEREVVRVGSQSSRNIVATTAATTTVPRRNFTDPPVRGNWRYITKREDWRQLISENVRLVGTKNSASSVNETASKVTEKPSGDTRKLDGTSSVKPSNTSQLDEPVSSKLSEADTLLHRIQAVETDGELMLSLNRTCDSLLDIYSTEDCWVVSDGVIELLKTLRQCQFNDGGNQSTTPQPVVIGAISNFDPRLDNILSLTGLRPFFHFTLNSYGARCEKPDRRIFDLALENARVISGDTGLSSAHAIHIGDKLRTDVAGANGAGWTSYFIGDEQHPEPHRSFTDLTKLKSHFMEICKEC